MSEVECAGSVEISRTFLPARLAANAIAEAHVVLPTPPLPPKNRIRFLRRSRMPFSNRAYCPSANDPFPSGDARYEILRGSTDTPRAGKDRRDSAVRRVP